ncbi:MAG TPA: TIGR03862 family flavoprotein [Alphaproteobacteria bacterium]|jgi:uncharacterized flavoprotein (TIGR03862 family)|nr:TIGR03862 family flavoprotein [Alphaproteobacteria bacterium]
MSHAVVIGGGPAGLMAAEALVDRGVTVDLYDSMPSLGRKFLMAGHGGLNLTHSEPFPEFLARFGEASRHVERALRRLSPDQLRAWARGLGIETFVGTSGRVFPTDFKAAPLLRAWLRRLRADGVTVHVRHRWDGWHDDGALAFMTPNGPISVRARATVLALGGASWPSLGSNGAWAPTLRAKGIDVAPLRPSNCGFDAPWSEHFRDRFAGQPVKTAALTHRGETVTGEFVVTESGIEGGVVYALSARLRDAIAADGSAKVFIDLVPGREIERIAAGLAVRGKRSLATALKASAGISGVKAGLLRECLSAEAMADPARVAEAVKALPLTLLAPRPVAEAISSAGGVRWSELNPQYMLRAMPGVFCAGEMLDWEAPTGGYLLTACMALGRACGEGVADWLSAQP